MRTVRPAARALGFGRETRGPGWHPRDSLRTPKVSPRTLRLSAQSPDAVNGEVALPGWPRLISCIHVIPIVVGSTVATATQDVRFPARVGRRAHPQFQALADRPPQADANLLAVGTLVAGVASLGVGISFARPLEIGARHVALPRIAIQVKQRAESSGRTPTRPALGSIRLDQRPVYY